MCDNSDWSICPTCGAYFIRKSSQHVFCSEKCAKRHKDFERSVLAKRKYLNEKFGGRCCLCGYDKSLSAIDFHHIDSSKKNLALTGKIIGNFSLEEQVLEELNWCLPLCANCHREIHCGIIPINDRDYLIKQPDIPKHFLLLK